MPELVVAVNVEEGSSVNSGDSVPIKIKVEKCFEYRKISYAA
jgi:hypothetical protein